MLERISESQLSHWWQSPQAAPFDLLEPTARFLNSFPAGNGDMERHFGKTSALWQTSPLRQASAGSELFLHCNAGQIGLPGYSDDGQIDSEIETETL